MKLSEQELNLLKSNSLSLDNVRAVGSQIESDLSVGGIFPKANAGDYSNPDIEKFKAKWCSWWPVARILLTVAKAFTGDKADKAIDELIKLGNSVCE